MIKKAEAVFEKHPRWVMAGVVAVTAVAVLITYATLKRPGDESCGDDCPPLETTPAKQTEGAVNWPLYGFSPARTRYLPAKHLKPPFKTVWKFNAHKLTEYSPIVVDGTLYGINNNGLAFAIDADTGKARWQHEVASLNASAPTYSRGRLFISNLEPGQVIALDAKTGRTLWQHSLPGRSESSPVVVGNKVIMGCECASLFALDFETGKTIWDTPLSGAIKAAPAFVDGVLYVGAYGGEVSAVKASNGALEWSSSGQGSGLGASGNFYGTPAAAFGRVFEGNTDGRMYSYERSSGNLAWSLSTGNYVYAGAVAADTPQSPPSVYFGSYDGNFYALDAHDGSQRWVEPAGGAVSGAGSMVGEVVYVANLAKTRTVGFRASDGKRMFNFPDGAYNPVISDGQRIYLTGYKTIYALEHVSKKKLLRAQRDQEAKKAQDAEKQPGKSGEKSAG